AGFHAPAWLEVSATVPPARLLPEHAGLATLAGRIAGAGRINARLDAHPAGGWQFEAHSDLRGVALELPAPLIKPPAAAMPLDLSLRGHDDGLTISARLGDLLSLTAEDADGRWRLAAGLGQAAPALPSGEGFELAGRVERLDLKGWSDALAGLLPASGRAPESLQGRARLRLERIDYGEIGLEGLALDARRRDGDWRMSLS